MVVRTAGGGAIRKASNYSPPHIEGGEDPYQYPITTKSRHPAILVDGDSPQRAQGGGDYSSHMGFTAGKETAGSARIEPIAMKTSSHVSPDLRMIKRKSFTNMGSLLKTDSSV